MSTETAQCSLLYEDPDALTAFETAEEPAIFADLNLDQIVSSACTARAPYALESYFYLPLRTEAEVYYRQRTLTDLKDPETAACISAFATAMQKVRARQKQAAELHYRYQQAWWFVQAATEIFVDVLHRLRSLADGKQGSVHSDGLTSLFTTLRSGLSDGYFDEIQAHLRALRFRRGITISARLGDGVQGREYVLRQTVSHRRTLSEVLHRRSRFSFTVPDRDDAGHRALTELADRGLNPVANAARQSADHILSFFLMLQRESGFYVACLNLYQTLTETGCPVAWPAATARSDTSGALTLHAKNLCDTALAQARQAPVVANDIDADGSSIIVVTGANQGGKSTFLRSVGLAFVLMQAGMFVTATDFAANVSNGIFTHFKREEDKTMHSGKLDEELARMSAIVDVLRPGDILLCNESFASTNEREGSEISRQILVALADAGIRVLFVTHLYDFAEGLFRQRRQDVHFLRAEREPDGHRTLRIVPGEPLPTSFGPDVYALIFTDHADEYQPAWHG